MLSKNLKALVLDVDGTLISGNNPVLSKDIKNWVFNSKKHFDIYLFSNNPSKKRIKLIADELDLEFTHSGGKPSKKKLNKLIDEIPHSLSEIAIIGCLLYTSPSPRD